MVVRCHNCMNEYDDVYGICPNCGYTNGTPAEELYHLVPGYMLADRYLIGTAIGSGGFGITYLAYDTELQHKVAVKEYYPSSVATRMPGEHIVRVYSEKGHTEFNNGLQRFLEEARNLAKFQNHPNIVNVSNFFEDNNTAYIVMEYMEGFTFKEYIKSKGGKIPYQEATQIIVCVLDALKEVHSRGIIHRDISPDNIMICQGGKVKLFDFGAARFSSEEEMTRSIILKPGFAPVEQYRTKSKQGPWTDIYAVGATMYLAITGSKPDESMNRVIEDRLPSPDQIDNQIPENISNSIMKAMALDFNMRFMDVYEFRDALLNKKKILQLEKELRRRKFRRNIVVALIALALVAGGIGVSRYYASKKSVAVLEKAKLTLVIKDETGDKTTLFESALAEFMNDQPNVDIEIKSYAKDYQSEIADTISNDRCVIFDSSDMSMSQLEDCENLSDVLTQNGAYQVDVNNYYGLKDYGKVFDQGKQIPLAMSLPVVYVYTPNQETASAVLDYMDSNALQLGALGDAFYYVNPSDYDRFVTAFGGKANLTNEAATFDDSANALLMNMMSQNQYASLGSGADTFAESIKSSDNAFQYYFASTNEYSSIQPDNAGFYKMRPYGDGQQVGYFEDLFSISKNKDAKNVKAAKALLRYLLRNDVEETLYVSESQSYSNAIPIETEVCEMYVGIMNDGFDKLSFKDMQFVGDDKVALEQYSQSLYEQK